MMRRSFLLQRLGVLQAMRVAGAGIDLRCLRRARPILLCGACPKRQQAGHGQGQELTVAEGNGLDPTRKAGVVMINLGVSARPGRCPRHDRLCVDHHHVVAALHARRERVAFFFPSSACAHWEGRRPKGLTHWHPPVPFVLEISCLRIRCLSAPSISISCHRVAHRACPPPRVNKLTSTSRKSRPAGRPVGSPLHPPSALQSLGKGPRPGTSTVPHG